MNKIPIKMVPFKRHNGTTLNNYLKSAFKIFEIKENHKHYIIEGFIGVNGNKTQDQNYYISQGDYIEIFSSTIAEPVPPKIDIIFQDQNICVINKKPGVHSVDSIWGSKWPIEDTLRWIFSEKECPNPFVAAVHRLDVDTSGILVIAIKKEAASFLGKELEKRKTEKIYHAIVSPSPLEKKFTISSPIGYDISKPGRWICFGKNAKEAITSFEIVKTNNNLALLKCLPLTGRTHQLRVHLKHNKTPIVGDSIYGVVKEDSRLMLHCSYMKFPDLDLNYSFTAPLPDEFQI